MFSIFVSTSIPIFFLIFSAIRARIAEKIRKNIGIEVETKIENTQEPLQTESQIKKEDSKEELTKEPESKEDPKKEEVIKQEGSSEKK